MATCNVETLMQNSATSGFTKLAERNKLDVLLQLLCNISDSGGGGGVLTGSGAPADTLGDNGNLYVDTDDGTVYSKANGTWAAVGGAELQFAVTDEYVSMTTGDDKMRFRMPYAMTLTDVRAGVNTAPTGSDIQIDIELAGASIFSSGLLTIDSGDLTSVGSATDPTIGTTSLTDDGLISINIDQVGSTIAGTGLKVLLIGTKS